jgi:hypothetical protein
MSSIPSMDNSKIALSRVWLALRLASKSDLLCGVMDLDEVSVDQSSHHSAHMGQDPRDPEPVVVCLKLIID